MDEPPLQALGRPFLDPFYFPAAAVIFGVV